MLRWTGNVAGMASLISRKTYKMLMEECDGRDSVDDGDRVGD
jgi:hypothetical protein